MYLLQTINEMIIIILLIKKLLLKVILLQITLFILNYNYITQAM